MKKSKPTGSQNDIKIAPNIVPKTFPKNNEKKVISKWPTGTPRQFMSRLLPVAGGVPFSRIQGQVLETVENNRGKKAEA